MPDSHIQLVASFSNLLWMFNPDLLRAIRRKRDWKVLWFHPAYHFVGLLMEGIHGPCTSRNRSVDSYEYQVRRLRYWSLTHGPCISAVSRSSSDMEHWARVRIPVNAANRPICGAFGKPSHFEIPWVKCVPHKDSL